MAKFFLFIYNFLFILLLIPASFFILIFSGKYRKEFFYKIPERLAMWPASGEPAFEKQSKKVIWIHCSSLGEVRAVEPILDALKQDFFIVLTAITKTGREYAQKIQKADFVSLIPLDIYPLMLKAFDRVKPDIFVLVETELWASMLYAARKRGVKTMTVNGRMSAKTFKVYGVFKFFWKHFISLIDVILARSREDADRFAVLAGNKSEIYVTGNIKYDRDFSASSDRSVFGLSKDDLVFTAGSTREGEEEIIADAYKKISLKYPAVKFFLVPRHIARLSKVEKILSSKNITYSLFSKPEAGTLPEAGPASGREPASAGGYENNFILVDVFGKLQNVYAVSDICYVGGSIVDKGGQNPIEPAAYGKPVLFGIHMDNFKSESEILVRYGGAITVFDANDIVLKIEKLLSNREFLEKTGQNALKAVNSQKGSVRLTVQKIKEFL